MDDVISTVSILTENWDFTSLQLDICESIDSDLACRLAEALHNTSTLKELELVDHPIGTKGAIAIVKLMHNNTSLKHVEVRGDNADITAKWCIPPSPKVLEWRYATCTISVEHLRELCDLLASTSNSLDIIQTYDDAYYNES